MASDLANDKAPSTASLASPATSNNVPVNSATTSGKKRKSKSIASRGPTAMPKWRGTGFEEYYAEPPITPAEHEEEEDLYHETLSFEERIETCIQRYRARRRMDNERTLLFNRYLTLGGIDCTQRMFNGTSDLNKSDGLTKDDLRSMQATDVVPQGASTYSKFYAADNASLWKVDFTGVVSGFFSVSLLSIGSSSEKRLTLGIDVVDNFLRYLQLHNVCTEYADDIKEARKICVDAQTEMPNCRKAIGLMPGQFNLACVKLFLNKPEHFAFDDGVNPLNKVSTDEDAELVFRTTVKLHEDIVGQQALDMANADNLSAIHIVATKELDLEITGLISPTEAILKGYTNAQSAASSFCNLSSASSTTKNITPAGVVIAKHCIIEDGYANQPHPSKATLAARGSEAFFLDAELMAMLCKGTKLRVVMHELNCDFSFVSMVKDLVPSYYTFLPQELMLAWKEPRDNEREPPSVENPDADEKCLKEMYEEE